MKRQNKIITVALAAACAALAGVTVATPAQASILATEDFSGVTLSPNSTIALQGVSDGTGWKSGTTWLANGSHPTTIPGYNVSDVTPLTGADNNNYATGGYGYGLAYRYLDTTATGTFGSAGLVNNTTHHIGVAGTTILMSVLLEANKVSNSLQGAMVALGNNNSTSGSYANAAVGDYTGYPTRTVPGDWVVSTTDGGPSPNHVYYTQSSTAVTAGQATELVMEIQYTTGTAANLSMWVNPAGYNSLHPTIPVATPDATLASTDATFSTVVFYSTNNSGAGADFSNFVLATPSSVPEPATLGLVAMGGLGLLLIGRRKQT